MTSLSSPHRLRHVEILINFPLFLPHDSGSGLQEHPGCMC